MFFEFEFIFIFVFRVRVVAFAGASGLLVQSVILMFFFVKWFKLFLLVFIGLCKVLRVVVAILDSSLD